VRDALAEARGSFRVVVRLRPLLSGDLATPGSLDAALVMWLVDRYAEAAADSAGRLGSATFNALARWLGWRGSFEALLRACAAGRAARAVAGGSAISSVMDGVSASGAACDGGPLVALLGLNVDATKEMVAVPPPLDSSAILAALLGRGGGVGARQEQFSQTGADKERQSAGADQLPPALQPLVEHLCQPRVHDQTRCFEFDRVLDANATQAAVFEGACAEQGLALRRACCLF